MFLNFVIVVAEQGRKALTNKRVRRRLLGCLVSECQIRSAGWPSVGARASICE